MDDISLKYYGGAAFPPEMKREMFWARKKAHKKLVKKYGYKDAKIIEHLTYKTTKKVLGDSIGGKI